MKPAPADTGFSGTSAPANHTTPAQRLYARQAQQADFLTAMLADSNNFSGSDVADIAHYLCLLHGRYPGVVDHLADRHIGSDHHALFSKLAGKFATERTLLTNMTVAAGPVTSLAGEDNALTAIEQLRQAIDLLARSDRDGCTLGAAAAVLCDWLSIRPALDMMLPRIGLESPIFAIADDYMQLAAIVESMTEPRQTRAVLFGIDQLFHQHDQFWLLLERRRSLRNEMLRQIGG